MRESKERENIFQIKDENEKISFKFYLQVLVLIITEIQLHKYQNSSP